MDRVQYEAIVIQDLINLEKDHQLNLSPWYQRRSVWNDNQKGYLINTLFEKKPIPALYIRHSLDLEKSKSVKEVVDGQQRTRSIIEYYEDKYPARHPKYHDKVLFSSLTKSEKESFLLTSIPVGYLLGASDNDVIDIFARINSISKSLNTQEKLNAAFSGEFKQFCISESTKRLAFWRDYNIFSATKISRMEEVAFVSEVIINLIDGISDSSQSKTEAFYSKYDDDFPKASSIENRIERIFAKLADIEPSAIKETIFSRSPLLLSLFLVLDREKKIKPEQLEKSLFEIDSIFNSSDLKRSKKDADFIAACSASTQRKAQRTIRDKYISSFLG